MSKGNIAAKVQSALPIQSEAEALKAKIAQLEAALNAAKNNAPAQRMFCKVSEKGAVSVYGMGRFPVTLYREQWERLSEFMPTVKTFIEANRSKLSSKADKLAADAAKAEESAGF